MTDLTLRISQMADHLPGDKLKDRRSLDPRRSCRRLGKQNMMKHYDRGTYSAGSDGEANVVQDARVSKFYFDEI